MGLSLTTAPAAEPVSVTEAKDFARVLQNDEDTLISSLITAARRYFEKRTHKQLIDATYTLTLDSFPSWNLWLPRPPLSSVTSITYTSADDVSTVLATSKYRVLTSSTPGRVVPEYGESWPSTRTEEETVTIVYVAGYGTAGTDCPEEALLAIKMLVAHWLEFREPVTDDAVNRVPLHVERIIGSMTTGDAAGTYRLAHDLIR